MTRALACLAAAAAPWAAVPAVCAEAVTALDIAAIVDGDAIPASLTGAPGDPARGAALVVDRQKSLCLLCHSGPFPEPHAHGDIGPNLTGVGARLTPGQIRLRIADMRRLDPASVMPSYLAPSGGARIAEAWRGRPLLTAAEIEDLVAYLAAERN